jgi:predicted transcriptional regulator
MARLPLPTEAEVAILGVLWRRGPCTVRQVLDQMEPGTGYTTVLKLMQIMTEKQLLVRDEAARSHVYKATVPEAQTLRALAGHLLDRAFDGSAKKLLVAALSARPASAADLGEMRRLIRRARARERKPS